MILAVASTATAQDLPKGALPDAIVSAGKNNLKRAWLAKPTKRYGHGILGDTIEAGSLVVETSCRRIMEHVLDDQHVFEDREARLVDLENDIYDEIVVIESNLDLGAALAVYGSAGATCSANGGLKPIARTPFIGPSNRWLNVAGIADYDGDGVKEIAIVVTPHIGGTLQFWSLQKGKMVLEAEKYGFSNHAIGSRAQKLSATVETDAGTALIVPGADRESLHRVRLLDGKILSRKFADLHGKITGNMQLTASNGEAHVSFEAGAAGLVQVQVPVD